jgi:hypothetical protein
MGQLITIDINLVKEAYDVVNSLKEELKTLNSKYEEEHKELIALRDLNDREKIASILEEKGLVPYDKIVGLREGKLSKNEVESLKAMAQVDVEYTTSLHTPTKTASDEFLEASEGARFSRRDLRARKLIEDLESLKFN